MSSIPPLNIIIPMAGLGSRFSKDGYFLPKPLIRVAGRPMIVQLLSRLQLLPGDMIYIGLQKAVDKEHDIIAAIQMQVPNLPLCPVLLEGPTRGAADTLHLIIQEMDPQHLSRKTISLDCDTLYFNDVLAEARRIPKDSGCVYFFDDDGDRAIYSYIRFDDSTKRIKDIREKFRISQHANTGIYGFSNAFILLEHLKNILQRPLPNKGEYYTSAVISEMITLGYRFQAIRVRASDFTCVGTPKQLRLFVESGLRRKEYSRDCLVVFDLESHPEICQTEVTEDQILQGLEPGFLEFLRLMTRDGFHLFLSFESGFYPRMSDGTGTRTRATEFKYATNAIRDLARRERCLFPINRSFQKTIGW